MKNILVLCTGNSCRSQMAEGYLRRFCSINAKVRSAGIEAHGVNPLAISVMEEEGIDISGQTSKTIDEYMDITFDYVITVCDNANERCPVYPFPTKRIHHAFPDPAKAKGTDEEILNEFRKVRGLIKSFCLSFYMENIL